MKPLKITRQQHATIIKKGRKKFAEITYNKNPDYKFCIWHNRMCLSGYESEEKALERVFRLNEEQEEFINGIREVLTLTIPQPH